MERGSLYSIVHAVGPDESQPEVLPPKIAPDIILTGQKYYALAAYETSSEVYPLHKQDGIIGSSQ